MPWWVLIPVAAVCLLAGGAGFFLLVLWLIRRELNRGIRNRVRGTPT
ncbi:hypothetical protein [Hypericibacter terrae]|nr:hypothetical protein [Hypericibacter terrae]